MPSKLLYFCICVLCLLGCTTTAERIEKIASETIQDSLHDPRSFELIKIDTLDFQEYLDELNTLVKTDSNARYNFQLILQHRKVKDLTLVHIHFRAKNAYGALRIYMKKLLLGNIESPSKAFGLLLK